VGKVLAAVSGGVDSAVTAARLIDAGHDVSAVTLRMVPEGQLSSADESMASARAVAEALGIEHVVVDAVTVFDECVLDYLADAYAEGLTPNPCVRCNERVKFEVLLAEATRRGIPRVATGHYARVVWVDDVPWVARGFDVGKDQSYFLYRLGVDALARMVFPLGESTKADVRAEAEMRGLPAARRTESQDVCFTDQGGLIGIVTARHPDAESPGPIVDDAGRVLGTHRGLAHYTVGQRKGLGIGGPVTWYVSALDPATNTVHVSPAQDMTTVRVQAVNVVWRGEAGPIRCEAQVRYRAAARPVTATFDGSNLNVTFDSPVSAPAPGQSVVCYVQDRVIGGGEIVPE